MSLVVREHRDRVAILTLNRPDVHNALNHALVRELIDSLEELASREDVGVVILTGAGDEAFCAGADLREMTSRRDEELAEFLTDTRRLFQTLSGFVLPTIAALNGHTQGGGAELACACDLRIGSPHVTFRFPGASYGLAVGTWHLPTIVGVPKAKELLFTTDVVEATEALRIGLLNAIVEGGELLSHAVSLARRINRHPRPAIRAIKSLIDGGIGAELKERFLRELRSNEERRGLGETKEAFRAFFEKGKGR